jgi:hypothetical protein
MKDMEQIVKLESELNEFDPAVRRRALSKLADLAEQGAVPLEAEQDVVNMHCHTIFSYNAYGHSPASVAWLARRRGFKAVGIVDFDVLDGVDEFLNACLTVGVRGGAGIETRVFVPEYAGQAINSPREPGVCYHMGIGFTTSKVPASVEGILADLGRRADRRNQGILSRVNAYLEPVTVDYERDVLPLTPAGHPTERHMVVAYVEAAERSIPDPVAFWAGKLDASPEEMTTVMTDATRFQNLIRAKLMKRGGVGYVQPDSGMFPTLDAFQQLIVACGALPCAAWLDGTTATEQNIEDWLAFLIGKGTVALNIIPDRNWNIADPEQKELKVRNLYRVVELAGELDLPLNVGTEMNSPGQKLVDGFSTPELAPVAQAFLDGAYFIYGHTVMERALGLGYQSEWAQSHFVSRHERNEFYSRVGHRVRPGETGISQLQQMDSAVSPGAVLSQLAVG